MRDQNCLLDVFLAHLYLYRDRIYQQVVDETADSVNLSLKKLYTYHAFCFKQFYQDILAAEIEKQNYNISDKLREIYASPTPKEDYEAASKLSRESQFPQPDPHQLHQEQPDRQGDHARRLPQRAAERGHPGHFSEAGEVRVDLPGAREGNPGRRADHRHPARLPPPLPGDPEPQLQRRHPFRQD